MSLQPLPAKQIRGVFSDLDDTLTDGHRGLAPETYRALGRLKDAGYWLVIVSGRPAGWADCLMRLFPLDAMVFENGAGVLTRAGNKIETTLLAGDAIQKRKLTQIYETLKERIPHLALSKDQPFRLYDVALDFAEEGYLSESELAQVLAYLETQEGVTAKLSSIHVNYWWGEHTKITACEYLLRTQGVERGITADGVIYCGDSPNDEPLFEFFRHSLGVANVKAFLPRMKFPPKYIASQPGGAGFCELAEKLLSQAR